MHEPPLTGRLRDFYFRIDLRSAGLFRILLAVILICHWFDRWHLIDLFYSAAGVLPARVVLDLVGPTAWLSPLCWPVVDESPLLVRTFFILALGCYVAFLIGYRTRLFGLLSLLAVGCIAQRNLYCLIGADFVMGSLLLWAQFLPVGKRFSWDSFCEAMATSPTLRDRPWEGQLNAPTVPLPGNSGLLVAALGVILNLGLIYLFTALQKLVPMAWGDSVTWTSGSAIWYVWNVEQSIYLPAHWFRQLPVAWIKLMTWGTLAVELAALPMFLIPFAQPWLRRIILLLLVSLHAGIAATYNAGLFSYTMFAGFALLLMAPDWEALRRLLARFSRSATVYFDDECGVCTRTCQALAIWDRFSRLTFIGSSVLSARRHTIPPGLVEQTIVVFDERGRMTIKAAGAATIFRALPLPWHILRIIAWPGLRWISDRAYDTFASNRHRVSSVLKMTSCGIPNSGKGSTSGMAAAADSASDLGSRYMSPDPPAVVAQNDRVLHGYANWLAAALLLFILAANWAENGDPLLRTYLAHHRGEAPARERPIWVRWAHRNPIVFFPGAVQHWNMFAPDATTYDHWWVIDAETAGGRHIDLLADRDEIADLAVKFFEPPRDAAGRRDRPARNCTWEAYLNHGVTNALTDNSDETSMVQRELCRYLVSRHNATASPQDQIVKLRFYDIRLASPLMGQTATGPLADRLYGAVLADYVPATAAFESHVGADPQVRGPRTTIALWYPPRADAAAQMKLLGTRVASTAQERQSEPTLAWYYDGPYQEWREDGSPLQQGTMSRGKRVGVWTQWDEHGERGQGPYRDDLRDGMWTYLAPNGRLAEGPYVEGKQTGPWIRYYAPAELPPQVRAASPDPARAAVYERLQLVDGNGQGAAKRYFPDGTLWMSGLLDESKQAGVWEEYYPSGRLKSRGAFRHDVPHGLWKLWYDTGKSGEVPQAEGEFRNGRQTGKWTEWDVQGQPRTVEFDRGRQLVPSSRGGKENHE